MSKRRNRRDSSRFRTRYYVVGGVVVATIIGYLALTAIQAQSAATRTSTSGPTSGMATSSKPVILYVNQGNGVVNSSNFPRLLATATSHNFNTIFFQVYRSGILLFTDDALNQFASAAHGQGLKIFFALYFTNSTQQIPVSIYADGEDGINLDMSTLPLQAQTALLSSLSSDYSGKTAITTTDPNLPLRPSLLIIETYGSAGARTPVENNPYIHPGIVASVGVFTTSSLQDYEHQFQYALANSDGVMVFDYAGLLKAGY